MKINFKKIATVMGSTLMIGATAAMAAAASYPTPFVQNGAANVAVVYGAESAISDGIAATTIATNLNTELSTQVASGSSGSVTAGDVKVTEDEVVLGGLITASGSKIETTILDNKLANLADDKFSWDDGSSSEEYNYHEEITIGTSKVLTTLDDKKLTGVALSNENALGYRFVFDEALNTSAVGDDNADTLYLTIMGNTYEIEAMSNTSNTTTVSTSEKVSMAIGEEITVAGKLVKIVDIFDGEVEVEVEGKSEVISLDNTERINGIRIRVESVGYHSNAPESSKAILKVGEDISKTYSDGDEYIGQDEDDPLWVWDISAPGDAAGYIGVIYNAKINSANDDIAGDTIKYVGDGYIFPDNYVAVTLDSITDAGYQDLKIYFEDSEDLFADSDSSAAFTENVPVLVIEAEETDAITSGGKDTDKIFVYYNSTSGKIQTFYNDFDGDRTPTGKMRLANSSVTLVADAGVEVATIEVGDTNLDIDLNATAVDGTGDLYLQITNDDDSNSQVVKLKIGGDAINATTAGTLEQLGATDEDAEAADVLFQGVDVSTEDYDYMDHYGIKLSDGTTVQSEADDDMVTLSIPDEQVYAQVTVSMGATVDEDGASNLGAITLKDTEVTSSNNNNLIVVGGNCVNTIAAELLGVDAGFANCLSTFSSETGVNSGEALIKSFTRNGKVALLVAGYTAADTEKAVTYLLNKDVDSSSANMKVTSKDSATAIAA
jgi:hypothetical protein